jgi:hypothetical protein
MQSIDENWKLWNVPLAFHIVTGSHTAEAIGNLVADLIQPFLGI